MSESASVRAAPDDHALPRVGLQPPNSSAALPATTRAGSQLPQGALSSVLENTTFGVAFTPENCPDYMLEFVDSLRTRTARTTS